MFFVKLDRDPTTRRYTVSLSPKTHTSNNTEGPWPETDRYGEAGYWKDACELALEAARFYVLPISVMCPSEVPFTAETLRCTCGAHTPFLDGKSLKETWPDTDDLYVEEGVWRLKDGCITACPLCGEGWMLTVQPEYPISYISVTLTLDPDSLKVEQNKQDPTVFDCSIDGSMAWPW